MSGAPIYEIMDAIETLFHLQQDADGAELVYRLRGQISAIKHDVYMLKRKMQAYDRRLAEVEKLVDGAAVDG